MKKDDEYVHLLKKNPSRECLIGETCLVTELREELRKSEAQYAQVRNQRNWLAATIFVILTLVAMFHKYL